MKCVDVQKRIRPYLDDQLTDEELSPFLEHVMNCAGCHEDLEIFTAVYQALDNDDDDAVDYNFARATDRKLRHEKEELQRRSFYRSVRLTIWLFAHLMLAVILFTAVTQQAGRRDVTDRFGYGLTESLETEEPTTETVNNLPGNEIGAALQDAS